MSNVIQSGRFEQARARRELDALLGRAPTLAVSEVQAQLEVAAAALAKLEGAEVDRALDAIGAAMVVLGSMKGGR